MKAATMTVRGRGGTAVRDATPGVPALDPYVVDRWQISGRHGGNPLQMLILHREGVYAACVVAVFAEDARLVADLGFSELLAVDLHFVHRLDVASDLQAREVGRQLAHAVAHNGIPIAPITTHDRALWMLAADAASRSAASMWAPGED